MNDSRGVPRGTVASLLVCAATVLLAPTLAPTPLERSAQSRELERSTEEYLRPYVHMDHFAGTVLLARGDDILVNRALGLADRELAVPFTTDTRFRVGSITKDFTAALILSLRDAGKLALDDSLARFLPDFPSSDRIHIRHLLDHTHGIPNWRGLPRADVLNATGVSLFEAVRILGRQPLEFEPGARRRYGSSGYLLLAHLIERITAASYAEALRRHLLAPLGLEHTGSLEGLELVPRLADSYVPSGAPPWLEHPPPAHPAITVGSASAFSTARDLFAWSRSEPAGRLGWGESEQHGRRMLWTSGLTDGFVARVHRFPDEDITLVLLSNVFTPAFRPILEDLAAMMFGERIEPPETWTPARLSGEQRRAMAGSWRCEGPWQRFAIVPDEDRLEFEIDGDRFPLVPRSPTRLHLPTDYGTIAFSEPGAGLFHRARYEGGFTAECERGN